MLLRAWVPAFIWVQGGINQPARRSKPQGGFPGPVWLIKTT
ncbi:hypothetical protein Z950_703 [Sulfitobacter mediterraneus KCTC 32188]|nr:hypothetical protein Z950_703 [Sulfitobacter mediterraneus KCTC 32188]